MGEHKIREPAHNSIKKLLRYVFSLGSMKSFFAKHRSTLLLANQTGPVESPTIYASNVFRNYHHIYLVQLSRRRSNFQIPRARTFDMKGLNVFEFRKGGLCTGMFSVIGCR